MGNVACQTVPSKYTYISQFINCLSWSTRLLCLNSKKWSWSPICLYLSCFTAWPSQSLAQFFLFAGFPFYRFLLCKVTHYCNVFREQYIWVICKWTHLTICQHLGLVCLGFIIPKMSCPLWMLVNLCAKVSRLGLSLCLHRKIPLDTQLSSQEGTNFITRISDGNGWKFCKIRKKVHS